MGNCCSQSQASAVSETLHTPPLLHALSIWDLCSGAQGQLLTASEDKTVDIYDDTAKSLVHRWCGHQKGVNRTSYLPGASLAISGSRDTTVKVWTRDAAEAVATYSVHALPVTGLASSEDHSWICSGSRDCTLRLMDIATSAEVSYSSIPQNVVTDMKAVPGEAAVLQAGEDLQLRLWDTRTMQLAQVLPQHANIPLSCDVSSDGLYFATSCNGFDGEGCEVCVWDRRQLRQMWQCNGHTQATRACIFLPNIRCAVRTSDTEKSETEMQADATTDASKQLVKINATNPQSSSSLVASASADCTIKVWQIGRDEPLSSEDLSGDQEHAALTALALCPAKAFQTDHDDTIDLLFASSFSGRLHSFCVDQHLSRVQLHALTEDESTLT